MPHGIESDYYTREGVEHSVEDFEARMMALAEEWHEKFPDHPYPLKLKQMIRDRSQGTRTTGARIQRSMARQFGGFTPHEETILERYSR